MMRTALSAAFFLVAAFFALVGATMPMMLPEQAAKDRVYFEQFQQAASHLKRTGHIPSEAELRRLAEQSSGPSIWSSLTTTPLDCDPSFRKDPGDSVILSFWRGEWSECYAYPSGKTTLVMSVNGYLLSGVGLNLVIYWIVAALSAWGGVRLLRSARLRRLASRAHVGA
jgi:hypothetical protein